MSSISIGPYGALFLLQLQYADPVQNKNLPGIPSIYQFQGSLELPLGDLPLSSKSLLAEESETSSISTPSDDLFSFSRLLEPKPEILLDLESKNKLEQAFLFWSNASFDGSYYEPLKEGEDQAEFVERKRNWCKENIEKFSSVELLSITNCNLETIPKDIAYFKNLKHLDLSGNRLKLKYLEKLYLQYNEIEKVSEDFFSEMNELKEVYINHNRIRELKKFMQSFSEKSFKVTAFPQIPAQDGEWVFI